MISKKVKRNYNSSGRQAQSNLAKEQILLIAKDLFEQHGFDKVTIETIANSAGVSTPTVYAKFKSKRNLLLCIIDNALPNTQHNTLVSEIYQASSAKEQLKLTAKLTRKIYEAEQQNMSWLRGAAVIDPVFKQLEDKQEKRRYERQRKAVNLLFEKHHYSEQTSKAEIRDQLWALTGRDLYRMLVIERNWSPERYELWLSDLLISTLLG